MPTTNLIPSLTAKINRNCYQQQDEAGSAPSQALLYLKGLRRAPLLLATHRTRCSEPWCQCQHLTDPSRKLPTLLRMWARSGRSDPDRGDDAAVLETLHQGWSLDFFRPMQCVSYSWNEKTWASAWAFIADQKTNEAKNVSLISWLLQFFSWICSWSGSFHDQMNVSGGPRVRRERGNVPAGSSPCRVCWRRQ